jgi:hypothetical protein
MKKKPKKLYLSKETLVSLSTGTDVLVDSLVGESLRSICDSAGGTTCPDVTGGSKPC